MKRCAENVLSFRELPEEISELIIVDHMALRLETVNDFKYFRLVFQVSKKICLRLTTDIVPKIEYVSPKVYCFLSQKSLKTFPPLTQFTGIKEVELVEKMKDLALFGEMKSLEKFTTHTMLLSPWLLLLPNIKYFVTHVRFTELNLKRMPNLTHLEIHCHWKYETFHFEWLKHLPNLVSLKNGQLGFSRKHDYNRLSDVSPKLTILHDWSNMSLDDIGELKSLQYLALNEISDYNQLSNFPNLTYLYIARKIPNPIPNLTDFFLSRLPQLRHLYINDKKIL